MRKPYRAGSEDCCPLNEPHTDLQGSQGFDIPVGPQNESQFYVLDQCLPLFLLDDRGDDLQFVTLLSRQLRSPAADI